MRRETRLDSSPLGSYFSRLLAQRRSVFGVRAATNHSQGVGVQFDNDPRGTLPVFDYNRWLKSLRCEHEWQEDVAIRVVMSRQAQRFWDRFHDNPDLRVEDRQGLTLLAIARAVQHFVYERGKTITNEKAQRAAMVSMHIAIEKYRLPEPRYQWTSVLYAYMDAWIEHVLHPARLHCESGIENQRERALWREWDWICKVVGLPRDGEQMNQVGRSLAVMAEYIGPKDGCEVELAQSLLDLGRQKYGGWGAMLYVDKDGVVCVGPHQARDAILETHGISRPRRNSDAKALETPPPTILSSPDTRAAAANALAEYAADDFEDRDAVDTLEAVSSRDQLNRMRAFMEQRKPTLRVGSVAHAVADYVIPFSQMEIPLAQVAKAVGRSESAAYKEMIRLGTEMAEALKMT